MLALTVETPSNTTPLLRPLHDRVLLIRIPEEDNGLIVIPDVAQQKSWKGRVLACGPKVSELQAGDIVYFNAIWNDWEHGPEDTVLVQEADVICKCEETDQS